MVGSRHHVCLARGGGIGGPCVESDTRRKKIWPPERGRAIRGRLWVDMMGCWVCRMLTDKPTMSGSRQLLLAAGLSIRL